MSSVLQSIGDPLSEKETEVCNTVRCKVFSNCRVKQMQYIFLFFLVANGFIFGSGLNPLGFAM